jgi:hypothetical protein
MRRRFYVFMRIMPKRRTSGEPTKKRNKYRNEWGPGFIYRTSPPAREVAVKRFLYNG